jgi:hypothetical protein
MTSYYPSIQHSRFLKDADRSVWTTADDADFSLPTRGKIILAIEVGYDGKDTTASAYKLQWRDVTDAGSFTGGGTNGGDVAATGEVKYAATSAVLTDGTALTTGNHKCTSLAAVMTWQNGLENVGDNLLPDSSTYDLGSDCYTEFQFALDLTDAQLSHQYEFRLWNNTSGATAGTCAAKVTPLPVIAGTVAATLAPVTESAVGYYPTFAVHGDWPDYSVVPQLDHYWDLNNSLVDTPATGKTQLDLSNAGSGNSWVDDWAGRATQGVSTPATGDLKNASGSADLQDPRTTFTLFLTFHYQGGAGNLMESTGDTPANGWRFRTNSSGQLIYDSTTAGTATSYASTFTFTSGNDYHLVLSYSGGYLSAYVNGVLVWNVAAIAPGVRVTAGFHISAYQASGAIIYSAGTLKGTALTDRQAQYLYDTFVDCGSGTWKRHCADPYTWSSGIAGSISSTLAPVTEAASGALAISGAAAGTLVKVTAAASGKAAVAGAVAGTIAKVTEVSSGKAAISGSIARTLIAPTAVVAGAAAIFGGIAPNLAAVSAQVISTVAVDSLIDANLAPVTGSVNAYTISPHITGDCAVSLDPTELVGGGQAAIAGICAGDLDALSLEAAGQVGITATIIAAIEVLTAEIAGQVGIHGDVTAILAALTGSVEGTVTGSISELRMFTKIPCFCVIHAYKHKSTVRIKIP